ncbi:MAG: CCA tRNA nucleotidyltransferase, partial [Deltaproteobacteria bacterium]|nr:CCA tRNA nucleotidyltransferase [Deltaproteobacteria bacterium]
VYESPASLPIVELSSIKLDLYRRDFTVNTLALQLNSRHFGTLIDFFGAQKDIKEKTIRVLHSLSFVEDPTRVFRAIRFEKRFGFKIGKLTQQLIDNARRIDVFKGLSGRRLFNEIKLMLSEQHPVLCIARMNEFELLPILHPGLAFNSEVEDLFLRVDVVLNWYDLLYLENGYEKWKVHLLALADPLNLVEFENLLKRFEVPKTVLNELLKAKSDGQDIPRRMPLRGEPTRGEIYRLLKPLGVESLLFLMARTKRESLKKAVSTYFNRLKGMKLATQGKDLRRLGYPPGPLYGKILNALFMAKLNDELLTREDELEYLERVFPVAEQPAHRLSK